MIKWRILDGLFKGHIIAEGVFLDIDFDLLPADIQDAIWEVADRAELPMYSPEDFQYAVKFYEEMLDIEEVEDLKTTLFPFSTKPNQDY